MTMPTTEEFETAVAQLEAWEELYRTLGAEGFYRAGLDHDAAHGEQDGFGWLEYLFVRQGW